ncbi:MAG: CHAT domain-containing protein [Bacteroidia bacterium]|nr:CHAT domain-containing protein [Bacteroidia bacterium]
MIHAFKYLGLAIVFFSLLSGKSLAQDQSDDSYQADELAKQQFELALTNLNQDRNDTAIILFEEALSHYNDAENSEGVYTSGIYLAIALKKAGRLEDFLAHSHIFRSHLVDSDSLSAQLKLSLGASFFKKGDYQEALDNLESAQDRVENMNNNDLLHYRILENKARIYRKIEDAGGELKTHEEIEKLLGTHEVFLLEEDLLELSIYKWAALVRAKKTKEAENYHLRSEKIYRAYEDSFSPDRKEFALREMGHTAYEMGKHQTAKNYLNEYLNLASKQETEIDEAKYLLVQIAFRSGEETSAQKLLTALLAKGKELSLSKDKIAELHFIAGELKKAEGLYEEAIRQYQEVFKIWKPDQRSLSIHQIPEVENLPAKVLNHRVLWSYAETLNDMGLIDEKASKALFESSLAAYQKAMEFGEKLRNDVLFEEEEIIPLAQVRQKYEEAIQLAVHLGRINKDDRFIGIAFQFQQAAKAEERREVFFQYYRNQGVPWDSKEESRRKIFIQRLKDFEKEIAEIPFKEEREVLQSIRDNVEDEYGRFRQSLRYGDAAYFKLKEQSAQSSIAELRAQLGNYELLLCMFQGKEKLYLFELRKEIIDLRIVELSEEGNKPYLDFIAMVQDKYSSAHGFGERAYSFYQELLEKPLTDSTSSIVLVPDGLFHFFPFEVLLSEKSESIDFKDQPYLIRKYPIRYLLHSTDILPTKEYFYRDYQHKYAMFMPRPKEGKSLSFIDSLQLNDEERTNISNSDFPLLDKQEKYMEKRRKQMGAEIFAGWRASERSFRGYGEDYHSVEMAGYVVSSDYQPLYSGLQFSPQDDGGHFLAVHEILGNDLNNDLLILPNHAAVGSLQNGQGFRSLVYALEISKVQNLIISQWMMEENGNQIILEDLIKRLYVGTGKARALQEAKLNYLKTEEETHPYYWSGLVLYGDNIELEGEERPWWSYGALIFALFMLLLIIFGFRRKRRRR